MAESQLTERPPWEDYAPAGAAVAEADAERPPWEDYAPAHVGQLRGVVNAAQHGFRRLQQSLEVPAILSQSARAAQQGDYAQQLRNEYLSWSQQAAQGAFNGVPVDVLQAENERYQRRIAAAEAQQQAAAARVTESAQRIGALQEKIQALPAAPAVQRWNEASGMDAVKTFVSNPFEITANIIAESFTQSLPSVVGGVLGAATAGPPGAAAGVGAGSFAVEYANSILESLQESGADLTQPEAVQRAVADPALLNTARFRAVRRGVPVAAFDAVTAGLAGKFLGPTIGNGAREVAIGSAREAALQAAGGAAGEASAQVAAGEPFRPKEIFAEAIAELGTGVPEVASNVRAERVRQRLAGSTRPATPAALAVEPPTPPPVELPPEADLVPPPPEPSPVPESPQTLAAQVALTENPASSKAVTLVTPGEAMPALPEDSPLVAVPTVQGTALVNPAKVSPEVAQAELNTGGGGRLLGLSTDTRPAGAAVLQTRDASGTVVQDEVVTPQTLPQASAAGQAVAPGGTQQLVPPQTVVADRLAAATPAAPAAPTVVARPATPVDSGRETPATTPPPASATPPAEPAQPVPSRAPLAAPPPVEAATQSGGANVQSASPSKMSFEWMAPAVKPSVLRAVARARELVAAGETEDSALRTAYNETIELLRSEKASRADVDKVFFEHSIGWTAEARERAALRGQIKTDKVVLPGVLPDNETTRSLLRAAGAVGASRELAMEIARALAAMGFIGSVDHSPTGSSYVTIVGADRRIRVSDHPSVGSNLGRNQRSDHKTIAVSARGPKKTIAARAWAAINAFANSKAAQSGASGATADNSASTPQPESRMVSGSLRGARPRSRKAMETPASFARQIRSQEGGDVNTENTTGADIVQRLEQLKVKPGTTFALPDLGISVGLWNGALSAAQAAIKAGRTIAQAIEEAVQWLRQRVQSFDEARVRSALQSALTPPPGSAAVAASAGPADKAAPTRHMIKAQDRLGIFNNLFHRVLSDDEASAAARALMAEANQDPMAALGLAINRPLPDAVRVFVIAEVSRELQRRITAAEQAGNIPEAERLSDQLQRLGDDLMAPFGTNVAQATRALRYWNEAMPARAYQALYRNVLAKYRDTIQRQLSGVLEPIVTTFNLINREALQSLYKDAGIQGTVTGVINDVLRREAGTAGTPLQQAVTLEATNNLKMLPAARAARERAVIAALRGVPREYWSGLVRRGARSLEAFIEKAVKGTSTSPDTVAQLAGEIQRALQAQITELLGASASKSQPGTYASRLLNLINNAERLSQLWQPVRDQLARQYQGNEAVQRLLSAPMQAWSKPLLRGVMHEYLRSVDVSLHEIVAGHWRAANDGRTLAQKIVERLGVNEETARALQAEFENLFNQEVFKIRGDLDNRANRLRKDSRFARLLKSGLVSAEWLPESEVDRAILSRVRELRLSLGSLIYEHWTKVAEDGRSLARKLVEDIGLPADVASKVESAIANRFQAQVDARKRAEIARLIKDHQSRAVDRLKRKGVMDRLVAFSNLGALDSDAAFAAVADKLGLPAESAAVRAEIKSRAERIAQLPEGSAQRLRETARLMQFIHDQVPPNVLDLAWGVFYGNLLSGPTTLLGVNILSNASALLGGSVALSRGNPIELLRIWGDMLAALPQAFAAGRDIIKSGYDPRAEFKWEGAGRALERDLSGWRRWLKPYRYIGRILPAQDAFFYYPQREARARWLARHQGIELTAPPVEHILDAEAAQMRALGFEPDQSWRDRRRDQLIEEARPQDIVNGSIGFAQENTFNGQPYGLLGLVADGVDMLTTWMERNTANNPADAARNRLALLMRRSVVPFTRIVSNVLNEGLNYTPLGAARAFGVGQRLVTLSLQLDPATRTVNGRAYTPDAAGDLYAKSAIGTLLMAGVLTAGLRGINDDDEDAFQIYGPGPRDPDKRRAWMETGARPFSVKIGGRYYPYQNWVIGPALALVGAEVDRHRWPQTASPDEQDAWNRLAVSARAIPMLVLQMSFLDGLARLAGAIERPATARNPMASLAADLTRAGSSFVPYAGANFFRQLDRWLDPTVYDTKDVETALVASVPFVRRTGRPALNALGEPVQNPLLGRFVSEPRKNLFTELARRDAFPGVPNQGLLTNDEYYELIRVRGEVLRRHLTNAMPIIQRARSDAVARKIVEDLSQRATAAAKARTGLAAVEAARRRELLRQ